MIWSYVLLWKSDVISVLYFSHSSCEMSLERELDAMMRAVVCFRHGSRARKSELEAESARILT